MTSDPALASSESIPLTTSADVTSAPVADAVRRPVLNPTGGDSLKAVGSVDPSKLNRDIDAEAESEARPVREFISYNEPHSVDVPTEENLDADLEAEINAAMSAGTISDVGGATGAVVANELPADETLELGQRLKGKVALVHGENLFLDLGYRSQGILPTKQFEGKEIPAIGAEIGVVVQKVSAQEGLIYVSLPSGKQRLSGNWDEVQLGMVVDCMVTKTNKGGLEVTVGSLRGFLPSGQVDLRYVENLEPFVGQKLRVKIVEANKVKRNLIVSRKAILDEERREAQETILAKIDVGQTFDGVVRAVKDFGAFVDLGGVDGFLHIGQISWQHIKHPNEMLSEGQAVQVKIISVSEDKQKIGLSLKQLSISPWEQAATKYFQGQSVSGTITRLTDFGAFVQLEPGVEGMIHISELDHKRINRVSEVVSAGQTLELQVLEVDPEKRRIGLSLKALRAKPEPVVSAAQAAEEAAPAAPPPRRKTPLKGGQDSGSSRGGLFGSPSDFR